MKRDDAIKPVQTNKPGNCDCGCDCACGCEDGVCTCNESCCG